jgi:adenylate cyclase
VKKIVILFIFLVFCPVFYIADSIENNSARNFNKFKARKRLELQNELIKFKQETNPIVKLREILQEMESKAELRPEGNVTVKDFGLHDPEVFNQNTVSTILNILKEDYEIKPVFLNVVSADAYNNWAWYGSPLSGLDAEKRKLIEANTLVKTVDRGILEPVSENLNVQDNYNRLKKIANLGKSDFDGFSNSFKIVFSEMAYTPEIPHKVFPMATRKIPGKRLFVYYSRLNDHKRFYGGYFIVFSARALQPGLILKQALKATAPDLKRSYSRGGNKTSIVLSSPLSSEIRGYADLFGKNQELPQRMFVTRDLNHEYRQFHQLILFLTFFRKILLLAIFTLVFRAYLFGFTLNKELKIKFMLTLCILVLMPYLLLGYFASSLNKSISSLRFEEGEAELRRYIFELKNYYQDQKQQHLLRYLAAKKRMIKNINDSKSEILQTSARAFLEDGSVHFYRNDGLNRKFLYKSPHNKDSGKVFPRLSARFLDNLGVLQLDSEKARRDLRKSELTEAFVDIFQRGFITHKILSQEGVETNSIRDLNNFSRMVHFLLPENKLPQSSIKAIIFCVLINDFSYLYRPHLFHPEVFKRKDLFKTACLAMGRRDANDSLHQWWPQNLNLGKPEVKLLSFAASNHSSGFISRKVQNSIKVSGWEFLKNDSAVFAGELTLQPDLEVELVSAAFPFLLAVFSLISLFLFSDILFSLFIKPVRVFVSGAGNVSKGKYDFRIEHAKTDEIGTLAESFNNMTEGLLQRDRMRRFVSEDLYTKIKSKEEKQIVFASEKQEISILFSDIRNFTSLTEQHSPEEIVKFLNDYFTEMEAAITANKGIIASYVGDAVTAVFYDSEDRSSAIWSLKAAFAMRKKLEAFNKERSSRGEFTAEHGIGIATGKAISQVFGPEKGRKFFSVLGELPGMAEKLETASKESKYNRIVVGSLTMDKAKERFNFASLSVGDEQIGQAFDCKDEINV